MDKIDSLLLHIARHPVSPDASSPCPDVESLADYAAGRLPEAGIEALEAHLAKCEICLDVVDLSRRGELEEAEPMAVPPRVLEGVLSLVKERPSLWQVAVKLLSRGLEVVSQTGVLLPAQPLGVRGAALQESSSAVPDQYTFERELPPYTAQFSVQRQDGALVTLSLSLTGEAGPVRSLQVELWQGGRLRGVRTGIAGAVTFSGIQPGEYRLAAIEGGNPVGELYLSLLE